MLATILGECGPTNSRSAEYAVHGPRTGILDRHQNTYYPHRAETGGQLGGIVGPQVDGPVAFIGVGKIGTPMAARLIAAGHELVVYDKNQGAAERMAGSNVEVAESAAAAAEACDVVFTCLPGPN